MNSIDNKIIVVCGPTAGGKSSLALALAANFAGALVTADSMQVYKGLSVGTAATTAAQAGKTDVYLSGILPPVELFSVASWLAQAKQIISALHKVGTLPIVCGGTGLYIKNLLNNTAFNAVPKNENLRQALNIQCKEKGSLAMHAHLEKLDAQRAAEIHFNDEKRILRALEQSLLTGKTAKLRNTESCQNSSPYNSLVIYLSYKNREQLYAAINLRVDEMLTNGLLQEAELVWQNRHSYKTAAQAIGYKEFFEYFNGSASLESCTEKLKQASRNYAKRQLTWFNKMPMLCPLYADEPDVYPRAKTLVEKFLNN